jgi:hypothetical protein
MSDFSTPNVEYDNLIPPVIISTPRFSVTLAPPPSRASIATMTELRRSVEGGIQALMTEAESNANPNDATPEITPSTQTEEEEDTQSHHILITEVTDAVSGQSEPQLPPLTLPSSTEPESTSSESLLFSEDDLRQALADFQSYAIVPTSSMQIPLVRFVHSLMNEAIEIEDYETAEKFEKTIRDLNIAFQQTETESRTYLQTQSLESRLEEVKMKQSSCEILWEQKITEFKQRCVRKQEQLRQKHDLERQQFEQNCQTPDFLQRFTKPSSQLHQLWRLQKSLAFQHNFEAAKEVKQKAEALQQKETAEAQKRAMRSVQVHYDHLLLQQKREVECIQANDARKLAQLEGDMQREKEAVCKLNRQVETRLRDRRPPLKRGGPLPGRVEVVSQLSKRTRPKSGFGEGASPLVVKLPDIKTVLGGRPR